MRGEWEPDGRLLPVADFWTHDGREWFVRHYPDARESAWDRRNEHAMGEWQW